MNLIDARISDRIINHPKGLKISKHKVSDVHLN